MVQTLQIDHCKLQIENWGALKFDEQHWLTSRETTRWLQKNFARAIRSNGEGENGQESITNGGTNNLQFAMANLQFPNTNILLRLCRIA